MSMRGPSPKHKFVARGCREGGLGRRHVLQMQEVQIKIFGSFEQEMAKGQVFCVTRSPEAGSQKCLVSVSWCAFLAGESPPHQPKIKRKEQRRVLASCTAPVQFSKIVSQSCKRECKFAAIYETRDSKVSHLDRITRISYFSFIEVLEENNRLAHAIKIPLTSCG